MSSYPAYPHNGLYGPPTSVPPGIPPVPPGVSAASLGLRPAQHHVGIPMAHQGLPPGGQGDGSQMVPTGLQPGGHGMPQTSQGLPGAGHPAWCYLPPMSSASVLPVQPPDKEDKFNFGFTTTELPTRLLNKDVIDYAVSAGQSIANQPNPNMSVDNTTGTSNIALPHEPVMERPPAPKPSKPRKVGGGGRSSSGKKRQRQPELWKKNVSKVKKIRGEAHLSRNGTYIPAKQVETVDCTACSFKCNENFSEDLRSQLFNMFYSLGSNESQKQFVCQNVTEESTKQNNKKTEDGSTRENRRKVSRKYYLPENDNNRKQVCSRFFRGTLAVGKSFITHALKHKQFGCYMGQEKRGKPHNKTPSDQVDMARSHIVTILCMDTKSGKKKSVKKRCAEKGLTVAKMYEMFKTDCMAKNVSPVSLSIYRRIFHTEF
ncbi:uncharacterized protein LOC101853637 [Aplysia californica]|uniref:Uncharacterized protein LOC101853637 n=1 Tax=Aplysia californica TaxID=6500 RepID=A0ABM1VXL0_APLCA|nr:uncharacterized protein LOC101853637 [Aplysia californica]XP_005104193.1 uncharacterized protein LOC101853637 [Aplysia californica]XP_035827153.1 uncharacterized protein LOC101853637 [Aplysia californica]